MRIFNGKWSMPPLHSVDGMGGGASGPSQSPEESNRRMKHALLPVKFVIGAVLLVIAGLDSFYTLSENEMAVVTTFGRPA